MTVLASVLWLTATVWSCTGAEAEPPGAGPAPLPPKAAQAPRVPPAPAAPVKAPAPSRADAAEIPNCAKYAPPSTAAVRAQFDAFWAEFRAAVERGEKEAIANLTRFPLVVSGTFDDADPKKKLNRKAFLKAIDGMLDEQDVLEEKQRAVAETPRKYIVALSQGPQGCDYNDEQASVGNFRFQPKAGKWALVTVYSDRFNK